MVLSGMDDFPKCSVCGKPLDNPKHFVSMTKGFSLTCSKACAKTKRRESFCETCMDSYGVPHYMMDEAKKEGYYDKIEKKHGVRNVFQLESTKQASKKTKLLRHGDENYLNVGKAKQTRLTKNNGQFESEETKAKRRATFTKNYGAEHNMKSEKGLKEYEDAIEKKYGKGIRNISQVEPIKQKKIDTCRKNFGVDFPLQSPVVKRKSQQKCLSKYGVENSIQNYDVFRKARQKYFYDDTWFSSIPELAYYIWLTDHKIEFEYQPSPGLTYSVNGKNHKYFPDFKVNGQYVEIKGDQFFDENGNFIDPYSQDNERAQAKWQCMAENNVKVMRKPEYQVFISYVKQTYGCNYMKQFKRNKSK